MIKNELNRQHIPYSIKIREILGSYGFAGLNRCTTPAGPLNNKECNIYSLFVRKKDIPAVKNIIHKANMQIQSEA